MQRGQGVHNYIEGRAGMAKKFLSLASAGPACATAAQAADLKVAIDPAYEPFTYKTPDGKPTGL